MAQAEKIAEFVEVDKAIITSPTAKKSLRKVAEKQLVRMTKLQVNLARFENLLLCYQNII